MPFVNGYQQGACEAKASNDIAHGYHARWSCEDYSKGVKQSSSLKNWIPLSAAELEVHSGARGGKYRLVDGKKHYARKFYSPSSESKENDKKIEKQVRGKKESKKRKRTSKKSANSLKLVATKGKSFGSGVKILDFNPKTYELLIQRREGGKKQWVAVD